MPHFLASLEVDQRQNFILQADTLREMIGASGLIYHSVQIAKEVRQKYPSVELFWPVSGVLRFRSDDLGVLYRCLQEIRIRLEDAGLSSSAGIVPWEGDLDKAILEIDLRVRQHKDAKSGPAAHPSIPFFAPCGIQPKFAANHWRPQEPELRRRLVSDAADARLRERPAYQDALFKGLNRRGLKIPERMEDLVVSESDSYIAVIKADVDGLGRLLARLRFQDLGAHFGGGAIQASSSFTRALDDCMKQSARAAMNELSERHAPSNRYYPFVPLILAGDDLLILAQRHLALELALKLNRGYQEAAACDPVLAKALAVSNLVGKEALTLSFGVLFSKQGFPFDAATHLAEELVRTAKERRRELAGGEKEACIDFHWLASSGRESIADARRKGERYRDGDAIYSLVTRPWLASELEVLYDSAVEFAELPSRKAHQLDTVLRLGGLSDLAWKKWLSGLEPGQRSLFSDTPWTAGTSPYFSHWLEVAQIAETLRVPQEDSAQ